MEPGMRLIMYTVMTCICTSSTWGPHLAAPGKDQPEQLPARSVRNVRSPR